MAVRRAEGVPRKRRREESGARRLHGLPRKRARESFRSVLQRLGDGEPRIPRSFGGWKNSFRCERGRADLLFLICDGAASGRTARLPSEVAEAAERFGFVVEVEHIQRWEETGGRDVFAIRELQRRTFGVSELRR
jgi:hypothetical protein